MIRNCFVSKTIVFLFHDVEKELGSEINLVVFKMVSNIETK